MVDTQHFCLRWNNYQSSITSAFENLRDDEDFVDVTLACDGKSLKAHRVVLSACSPYFRELLKSTPCKHPVIVLQDVAFTDLLALVEFIYHGEVNVHQRSLSSFLKTAEVLRVSGLTQHDDAQGPLAQVQSLARAAAASSPRTPPHPAHTPHPPHTPSFTEKLEEALLSHPPPVQPNPMMRRVPLPPRRMSRSADNSPDVIKRIRHDNNNDQPQIQAADFSTKNHSLVNNRHDSGNNGNGISTSSGSPSPRLDDVKHEPLDMICSGTEAERATDDTPPHHHHRPHVSVETLLGSRRLRADRVWIVFKPRDRRPMMTTTSTRRSVHSNDNRIGGGPPSRGSSADADDRTPPPPLPPSPFIAPEAKLFPPTNTYNFNMASLADHPSLSEKKNTMFLFVCVALQSPLTPDGMAGTSQAPFGFGPTAGGGPRRPALSARRARTERGVHAICIVTLVNVLS
ncbi:hypothetical protein EVAR_94349_1 [Eumeta japonica]|uniref:BTB domain-containing protein n=1 Tax=Eumeta variegata TaxID=151549 RepID=A0A4C1TPU1_EUMVA|nr:hypothetical protein EVAR_94349_1 [Eumeta japonica]